MSSLFFVQMSGAPGSGKTTIATAVAPHVQAVILDHDVTKTALLESGIPLAQAGKGSYAVLKAMCQHLLQQKQSVILDSPCFYDDLLKFGQETAVIIAEKFPNTPRDSFDLLRECIPSVPAGLEAHFAQMPKAYLEAGAIQAKEAFDHFFQPLPKEAPQREELIVAHGNIINAFIAQAMEAPIDQWLFMDPFHCSHCQIMVLGSGKMKLVHYNNSGYLPAAYRSL